MSQESAGELVEVARSRMLPRTEDASLLDEGSHTVETDLQVCGFYKGRVLFGRCENTTCWHPINNCERLFATG